MIIVMKRGRDRSASDKIVAEIEKVGLKPVPLYGTERTVIAVIGDERALDIHHLSSLPGVDNVMRVLHPYKLASRETKHESTVIKVKNVEIGGKTVVVMAGPCSVESEDQMEKAAAAVKKAGATIMRGGAFKPRTGPYAFEGLGEEGLKIMRKVCDKHDLVMVTEVLDPRDVDLVLKYTDILQIGARNMQNFNLLKEVGKIRKPVLLKRGMSATIEEFLLAAEYIMSRGNHEVILCERGIRTFEQDTRNTLALATVPIVKDLSHLPIIVDPSHGTGRKNLIAPMSRAAIACGADGLMIEVHPNPSEAKSDADQSLNCEEFKKLMIGLAGIIEAVERKL